MVFVLPQCARQPGRQAAPPPSPHQSLRCNLHAPFAHSDVLIRILQQGHSSLVVNASSYACVLHSRYAFSPPDNVQPCATLPAVKARMAHESYERKKTARSERVAAAVGETGTVYTTLGRTHPAACVAAARAWNDALSRVVGEVLFTAVHRVCDGRERALLDPHSMVLRVPPHCVSPPILLFVRHCDLSHPRRFLP